MTTEIIELDQWSSTADLDDYTFERLKQAIESCDDGYVPKLEGGDSDAAVGMGIASFEVKEVEESDKPKKGFVWYRETEDGGIEMYKANTAST